MSLIRLTEMRLNEEVFKLNDIYHHGILGQKWGVRRYQNEDGTLTPAGKARLAKADSKWAHRNYKKITANVRKSVSKELNDYASQLLKDPSSRTSKGKLSATTINAYNKKMAELMNKSSGTITSPSGRVVRFVAKRGEVGVHMALADQGYDMSQLKNGVWASGRVAYKTKNVEMV